MSVGWWAMVRPAKGTHRLEFGATFPAFGFTIAMTYDLTVVRPVRGLRLLVHPSGDARGASWPDGEADVVTERA